MRFQAPRGTQDVLPAESHKWHRLEEKYRELVRLYGYAEVRTPTFEDTELFIRSSGETSDIVTKQMYTFTDKGDRSITLKPEGTAPAMRAMIENSLCPPGSVLRMFYVTPIFRYERPQKGRLREAHQFGLELVGSSSPAADAEIIELTVRWFEKCGVPDLYVLLNSIGRDECRASYRQAILDFAASYLKDQSEEFRARAQKNPFRLLDSKDPDVVELLKGLAPISDFWEDASKARFARIEGLLTQAGVPYRVSPEIVRGLDYYTETVFEVHSSLLGSQSALCGGGRYDNLVKEMGGPDLPSVGVGMGIERLMIVLDQIGMAGEAPKADVYVVSIGTLDQALGLVRDLRGAGLTALVDLDERSMKAQLRQADKVGARFAAILGEDEIAKGVVQMRDLSKGEQIEIPRIGVADWVKGRE